MWDLPWFERGQRYESYWLFVLNFERMRVVDGQVGETGVERKQWYFEILRDDLVAWWTKDVVKYGGVDGWRLVRNFTVVYVD
jgi:hypothetical protein